jgi:hypothetical protein
MDAHGQAQVAGVRPITIAVVALGGEGGGVLADWIVDLAQHGGRASPSAPARPSITSSCFPRRRRTGASRCWR